VSYLSTSLNEDHQRILLCSKGSKKEKEKGGEREREIERESINLSSC
jgi:hypothetical protein